MTSAALKRGNELETLLKNLREFRATVDTANSFGFGWQYETTSYPLFCHHVGHVPNEWKAAGDPRNLHRIDGSRLGENQLVMTFTGKHATDEDTIPMRNIMLAAKTLMLAEIDRLIKGYEKELADL